LSKIYVMVVKTLQCKRKKLFLLNKFFRPQTNQRWLLTSWLTWKLKIWKKTQLHKN